MTSDFSNFTPRLREFIRGAEPETRNGETGDQPESSGVSSRETPFNELALELFRLQFAHNAPYRRLCQARQVAPPGVMHWSQIPPVPTAAFKELELSSLPEDERTAVFHSSGTTGQRPSRHFHNAESLALYAESLLPWFRAHVLPDFQFKKASISADKLETGDWQLAMLTPPPAQAPRSSLVRMFESMRCACGSPASVFAGTVGRDGAWDLNLDAMLEILRTGCDHELPLVLCGTAFSFVHLLDTLAEKRLRFDLPAGSRVMETGGYKGRSRILPKDELHTLIFERLGIPPTHIVCEYGMSELSSQAYDLSIRHPAFGVLQPKRLFRFPPWARAQVVSPETGREVAPGGTGLIRVFDLANVFSVLAIQTEDLGIRRRGGFELLGRTAEAEPRGCSLMAAN